MSESSDRKKRTAKAAGMDPLDKKPTKKPKREAALEDRLTKLKQALDKLHPTWDNYDPGQFMEEMRYLGRMVNVLTPETVEEYINDGNLEEDLTVLDVQESMIRKVQNPEDPQLAQTVRRRMVDYVARVRTRLQALDEQVSAKPPPNEFADSKQWRVYQEREDAILCLRPAKKKGLPIPLMHMAFCVFTRQFHEPLLDEHTALYLNMANRLCEAMPSAFDSEAHRRDAFEEIFCLPGVGLTQHTESSLSVSTATESDAGLDVGKTIPIEGGHLLLLLEEFRGEPLGDVYMQICRAYEVLCGEAKNQRLLRFGNPAFLLCVVGPYLMVCGAIKRENVHVEPLTPLLPMFPGFGIEGRVVQIAHCLRALKQGLDTLKAFWQDVGIIEAASEIPTIHSLPEPFLVPDCPDNGLLHFKDWQGTFESPMPDANNPDKPPRFLAKIHNANECRQVVVKFVYSYSGTYGKAVHECLQAIGLAPILYSAKALHRGLVMVVMEHLTFDEGTGGWVELDAFEGKLGTNETTVRTKLEKIIDCLQSNGMVHADLRPRNIMIRVDRNHDIITAEDGPILSVIDFDWAGLVDEVCYPPLLNPKVPWPTGAKAYQKVGKDDDRTLLNNWWDAFVKGSSAT